MNKQGDLSTDERRAAERQALGLPEREQTKQEAEDQAWKDAYQISYPGASNPAAVASTLARNQAALQRHLGTHAASRHPAILTIFGQLAFLHGKALGPEFSELDATIENAKRLGIYQEGL